MPSVHDQDEERARLYRVDTEAEKYNGTVTMHERRLPPIWRRSTPYFVLVILLLAGFIITNRGPTSDERRVALTTQSKPGSRPVERPVQSAEETDDSAPIDKQRPDENGPDRAIVLSSYHEQDVGWLSNLPSEWRIYRYLMDDASLSELDTPQSHSPTKSASHQTYTVPRNQGREVMAYLTFIIDNYDRLPLFTIFLHGHDRAWHQIEHAAFKVLALNLTAVAQDGYITMRCGNRNRCDPDKICDLTRGADGVPFDHGRKLLPKFWKLMFPDVKLPSRLAATQGAQFAVTRETIQARSLEYYKRLRSPLLRDMGDFSDVLPGIVNTDGFQGGYQFGLLFEHVWHVIFGKPEFHCPDIEYCRNTVFSGAIDCDRYVDLKEETQGWESVGCRVDEEQVEKAKQEGLRAVALAEKESMNHEPEP